MNNTLLLCEVNNCILQAVFYLIKDYLFNKKIITTF